MLNSPGVRITDSSGQLKMIEASKVLTVPLVVSVDTVVPGNEGIVVPDTMEIAAGKSLELGSGAVMEPTGQPSGMIGLNVYAGQMNGTGPAGVISTTSATIADIDAVNMAVTFIAPSSGRVFVRLIAYADLSSATQQYYWALREGTALVLGAGGLVINQALGQTLFVQAFVVSNVTPGSHTWKWAHAVTGGATGRTGYGSGIFQATVSTAVSQNANNIMEVWAL